MSVTLDGGVVRVAGEARIEDAEALVALLQAQPGCRVDLAAASALHTAVVQVLLAFRPPLAGPVGDPFLNTWLLPALDQPGAPP